MGDRMEIHSRVLDISSTGGHVEEAIRAGEVFQVVLSQRFSVPCPADALDVYRVLRASNPSPYMYYYHFGDFQVVGASPEILVRVRLALRGGGRLRRIGLEEHARGDDVGQQLLHLHLADQVGQRLPGRAGEERGLLAGGLDVDRHPLAGAHHDHVAARKREDRERRAERKKRRAVKQAEESGQNLGEPFVGQDERD